MAEINCNTCPVTDCQHCDKGVKMCPIWQHECYCHHPEYYIAVDIFKDITGIYPTSNPIHIYLGDMLWGDTISKTKSCPFPWCPHNLKFLQYRAGGLSGGTKVIDPQGIVDVIKDEFKHLNLV